jgi:hypothetical protein
MTTYTEAVEYAKTISSNLEVGKDGRRFYVSSKREKGRMCMRDLTIGEVWAFLTGLRWGITDFDHDGEAKWRKKFDDE